MTKSTNANDNFCDNFSENLSENSLEASYMSNCNISESFSAARSPIYEAILKETHDE
jgi:hypothetical protein